MVAMFVAVCIRRIADLNVEIGLNAILVGCK